MARSVWDGLFDELDRWAAASKTATLWWRDDDACEPTCALETLLSTGHSAGVPVGLAVIPKPAAPTLSSWLERFPLAKVLQHGYAHINHAPEGDKKAEFGVHRPMREMLAELEQGYEKLRGLFATRPLPMFVPPWNRISTDLVKALPSIGLTGLSTYTARQMANPSPGLTQVNCHADLIDWHGSGAFVGEGPMVGFIVRHLAARREGRADAREPTGVLTHHLVHDDACWSFLRDLFERTQAHRSVRWLDAAEALCPI